MEFLTVVNRTARPLSCTWDGRTYIIQPGKSQHPATVAQALKRANPIMGSDDPYTGVLQYLVGIEEESDPIDPIEQSNEIELFNRKAQKNAVPIMIVPGNVGMFSVKQQDVRANLSPDTIPVKP